MKHSIIHRHRLIASEVRGRILDVGYAQEPNPFLKDVDGIDLRKIPKPANYVRTFAANFEEPKKYGAYDSIILGEVIEHVWNIGSFLDNAHQNLKAGGILIVTTPDPYYWRTMLLNFFNVNYRDDPTNKVFISRKEMRRLLEGKKFQVLKEKAMGYRFLIKAKKL